MTLTELNEKLQNLIEEGHDPDADVLIMSSPNWPFEHTVAGICTRQELVSDGGDPEDISEPDGGEVFIIEGSQLRYGNKAAWRLVE